MHFFPPGLFQTTLLCSLLNADLALRSSVSEIGALTKGVRTIFPAPKGFGGVLLWADKLSINTEVIVTELSLSACGEQRLEADGCNSWPFREVKNARQNEHPL